MGFSPFSQFSRSLLIKEKKNVNFGVLHDIWDLGDETEVAFEYCGLTDCFCLSSSF